ncbi:bifunctional [glutamate--ammonia ligase]-adenylyl-L-tyrosine phosphorylase/[glutamate--ammonia-ligase] adenylyltransferase [Gilvimarinus sp. SDUM040013]|uniref:Bifunctional glutamine synthetase adenylyltransferase/adenylyl-removing enzyme n=1 Tax=Gilvimarinus gilvus TaxID=3058038 RepID=A0ABU4RYD3_9GAMM|nr:bifunctional [glutamate--ammonia ligase]-adenylyl-L-tyrosine phosphorylase/[glutamate--ammonia-ligase] adenylyltransferase [Gilvimarinus sp. SDUM040013]MDO3387406.1 bifunctional [glutamate--ammonia ligase]-adenylyl-L-tyrosine phosphorylase/[glutamate--ammonia-ligase] adenylyltransferase [Gilvimarinus sp. SDUM040013]MDX6849883.1 bifunctional [glutamate--ammonia ligase]-adenylyl-L-tyrosine phosphorylase/[glutamate--ammonia-ligase] adenylyltransferase [Gilvimarinus sp. SDUM040013]
MFALSPLPDALVHDAQRQRSALEQAFSSAGLDDLQSVLEQSPVPLSWHEFEAQLHRLLATSEFVAQTCIRNPGHLAQLMTSGELFQPQSHVYLTQLAQELEACADDTALDRALRIARNRAMVRIVWRDFTRQASMSETTAELSKLADTLIDSALNWHYRALVKRFGEPVGRDSGAVQSMVVLGMGKLGALELNVSSDIDLIFAYPESGETNGDRKSLSNHEFFVRLGQKLIQSLDAQTADGFVFRVDMRLRPHGQSGALVQNYDALESYYQSQGRDWERYAMIKARPVAWTPGGELASQDLMGMLAPFTYRQYVDFSAIESLREMKGLINRQVQRKGMDLDVKLGEGGIREVEFVVQLFQLIRGGREVALRERQVCKMLPMLEAQKYLPPGSGEALLRAYIFLRNTEHAIQGFQDRQTQSLPMDEKGQLRLATVMGFADWPTFLAELSSQRQCVNREFQEVIADPDQSQTLDEGELDDWRSLWDGSLQGEEALEFLSAHGCEQGGAVIALLEELKGARQVIAMQASSRSRLDQFVPRLLIHIGSEADLDFADTLKRILPFVESVARRSAYLVLLVENPTALKQMVHLSAASPWIADQLAQHPILLDELLTPESLYSPPDRDALQDELRRELLRFGWDDLEGHMETLRYFRSAHALRVAASEVTGALPLMQVSDYLTYIAEAILEHVLVLAWEQMTARHGYPRRSDGVEEREPNFIVVGYGKLGGIELGHGSDLDLVFVHDGDTGGATSGEKSVDNLTFYTRLGQRIIHILDTQTVSGKLYEVDMRLRPSGNSGMLVTSLGAFEKYQRTDAWTWEHQALVRARPVAGSAELAQRFDAARAELLSEQRDLGKLRTDVTDMREKMRGHLGSGTDSNKFHLKQDSGGIVDIEFMVQYAVLAWAHKAPALTRYTDNIRILETLEQEALLPGEVVSQLIDAYKAYRSTGHRLALQRQEVVLQGDDAFAQEREQVTGHWRQLMLDATA